MFDLGFLVLLVAIFMFAFVVINVFAIDDDENDDRHRLEFEENAIYQ